ncbi:MAG: PqqD family protein [Streptosporangiaceae bacterium]|nr:PqqD family protein [Streptosporangiaceae bacterium]
MSTVDDTALEIDGTSVVTLYPLYIGEQADGVHEVGRPETGVFIQLPPEGVALLGWMADSFSLDEISRRFIAEYGVAPELDDFVDGMRECGFIQSINGQPAVSPEEQAAAGRPPSGWRLLASLPSKRVAWLLAPPLRVLYWAIWLAVPAIFIMRPGLLPRSPDAVPYSSDVVNLVVLTILGWLLIFLHELGHVLAVRARDCTGSLAISRRLYFVVAQTDMSGVRTIPRRQRYAPYLAGTTVDLAILLCCLGLRMAGPAGTINKLAQMACYFICLQILFQLAIFLRTDFYFVLTNWLRLGNLNQDTQEILRAWWRSVRRRQHVPGPDIPARERTLVHRYLPVYLLGIAAAFANLILYVLPVLVTLVARAIDAIAGRSHSMSPWDGLALLLTVTANIALLGYVAIRDRRAVARGR